MTLLSIDTSGVTGSLALAHIEAGQLNDLHQVEWTKKAIHSEIATVQLQQLLADTQTDLHKITLLAVNVGPGSFTGIRIGLSLAKTLAYSLALPVASVNKLETLAFSNMASNESAFVAIRAVQNFFYAASFTKSPSGLKTDLPPQSIEGVEIPLLTKSCSKVLIEGQTSGFSSETKAQDLIRLIIASATSRSYCDWKAVEPLYLRASEAEEKLKKGLLRPV